jgi:hypothetical protein
MESRFDLLISVDLANFKGRKEISFIILERTQEKLKIWKTNMERTQPRAKLYPNQH